MVNVETVIIVVVVVLFALSFGFCCHFAASKRRADELARQTSSPTQQTAVTADSQRSTSHVYMLHLQGTRANDSNINPTGNNTLQVLPEESAGFSDDPIAESGPPPYSGLEADSEEPPLPPPSYDEALRVTNDIVAAASPGASQPERTEHCV